MPFICLDEVRGPGAVHMSGVVQFLLFEHHKDHILECLVSVYLFVSAAEDPNLCSLKEGSLAG